MNVMSSHLGYAVPVGKMRARGWAVVANSARRVSGLTAAPRGHIPRTRISDAPNSRVGDLTPGLFNRGIVMLRSLAPTVSADPQPSEPAVSDPGNSSETEHPTAPRSALAISFDRQMLTGF